MARDRVIGTNGNDKLQDGKFGSTDIFAKKGNDTIKLLRSDDFGGNNFVDAGPGKDTVINRKEFSNIIKLGPGNDTYAADGFGFSIETPDQVFGGTGKDTFIVGTFHSLYSGNGGNDLFRSVGWENTFSGGPGKDTLSYDVRQTDSVVGDTGVNIDMREGFAFTGASRKEFFSGIENITGSVHRDEIFGNNAANVIKGLGGNDAFDAGPGNDTLIGGSGPDFMIGNTGRDSFVYLKASDSPANGFDVIQGFSHRQGDKINLKNIDANPARSGDQAFIFIGDKAFTGAHGQLRVANGFILGDINGNGIAELVIQLDGGDIPVVGDFNL